MQVLMTAVAALQEALLQPTLPVSSRHPGGSLNPIAEKRYGSSAH
jgi:hypothetical protein